MNAIEKLTITPDSKNGVPHKLLYPAILMSMIQTAHAGIITVDPTDLILNPGEGDDSFQWDVDGDSVVDFNFFDHQTGHEFCLGFNGLNGAGLAITPISNAMTVGAANTFTGSQGCGDVFDVHCNHTNFGPFSSFTTSANFTGVMGFRFDNNGTTNYGVAEFSFASWDGSDPTDGTFSINKWAYDDSGQAINGSALPTTSVPEPSSLALLALGAVGLRMRKKMMNKH